MRDWSTPQSLKDGGVNTLRIALRGEAAAFVETSPGAFLMNGTGTNIWDYADEFRFAYKQLKGNGSITARIDSVSNVNNAAKAGVMIRETLMPESVHAIVDITPGAGAEFLRRLETAGASTSAVQTSTTAPSGAKLWVKLTRNGNTFTAQLSADGVTWTSVGTDPAASSVTIPMASDVYIGLAVTSRVANGVCVARFSNVSTTGTVTGDWITTDVGIAQVPGNAPDTFYVSLQDSSGNMLMVSHPDPMVIATGLWEVWNIPLSQFTTAGVNLGSVKKMMIGVGNPNAPKAGAMGKLYIDDIRVLQVANP
jgi:regulation of enolase protein 1 (concanavalin A-like superfamily)